MPGLLADVNFEGHLTRLLTILDRAPFRELWLGSGFFSTTFDDLGWDHALPDDELWDRCQRHGFVLITGNRNLDGPRSLEATIRRRGRPDSFPVLTVGRPDEIRTSRDYANRVAERLLEYLFDLSSVAGAGRLYLP